MTVFYNEIDPFAAATLRELIKAGHIADGVVDERSIEDITPRELDGFTQCHFFAGIGVWSYALRLAGWPDDRPVWTGSCPCQPFSQAGAGSGFADERHLWPHFHWLIQERRPPAVLGEQVASKDADPWIDLVQTDLEALGYAFGAVPFPSAGVGAPHIRDRLYWVAHANGELHNRRRIIGARGRVEHPIGGTVEPLADRNQHGRIAPAIAGLHHDQHHAEPCGGAGLLGNAGNEGFSQRLGIAGVSGEPSGADERQTAERAGLHAGELGDTEGIGRERSHLRAGPGLPSHGIAQDSEPVQMVNPGCAGFQLAGPGPTNGFWRDADWLFCRDGRWRPVEPGTSPLAHGAPARVGRLRAYGNAINAQQAAIFIEAAMTPPFFAQTDPGTDVAQVANFAERVA